MLKSRQEVDDETHRTGALSQTAHRSQADTRHQGHYRHPALGKVETDGIIYGLAGHLRPITPSGIDLAAFPSTATPTKTRHYPNGEFFMGDRALRTGRNFRLDNRYQYLHPLLFSPNSGYPIHIWNNLSRLFIHSPSGFIITAVQQYNFRF